MSSSTSFGSGVFGSGPLGSAPFFDVKSLIDAVLKTTGHTDPSREATKRASILQFLNNSYQEIVMSKNWAWLFATYDINFAAPYTDGTVSATLGDQTITGLGTVWSANQRKGRMIIDGKQTTYNVASVDSTTSLELETKWSEDDVTGSSYKIYAVQYKLPPETDQVLAMVNDDINLKMIPMGPAQFRQMQARDPLLEGAPRYFSLIKRDVDDDAQYVEVYPMPDKAYNIHLDYTVRIYGLEDSDDCYPIIPDRYRVVLFYGALAQFYRFLDQESKAMAAMQDYGRALTTLRNDTQLTDNRLNFKPARSYRNRRLWSRHFSGSGFMDRFNFGRWD